MPRAFILVLDSLGIGATPDADKFGDSGANTLLHVKERCAAGLADKDGLRQGPLNIPNLDALGLSAAIDNPRFKASGLFGYASEMSIDKDTTSGHWEMTGAPVLFEWGYFPDNCPCFPQKLVDKFIKEAEIPGILGNCRASGVEIVKRYGDEHVSTKMPICYTSPNSVFQIAAHEEVFGLEHLYKICEVAYRLVQPYKISRVIARPFLGSSGNYYRTERRHDFSAPPPSTTLLDKMITAGGEVIVIGKIADIFVKRSIKQHLQAYNNDDTFDVLLTTAKSAADNSLTLVNFIDFDTKFGHRRDVVGYAHALEQFDQRLPEFITLLQPEDIVVITSDHGCDPTYKGSDHTREYVPILLFGSQVKPGFIGARDTFADIGQSIAKYLNLEPLLYGTSFL